VTGRGSLSTRPSRWRHETLTRTSTAKEIAAVDRNVKSRTTVVTTNTVSAFPETLDFSWADFSAQISPETSPVSSPFQTPRATPTSSPFQTPRAIPQYLIPQYSSLPSSPGSLSPSSPSSPVSTVSPSSPTLSTPTTTPFQSPSPLFHQQQAPRAIATASSPSFFWGSPNLGSTIPSSSFQTLSHVQTPRTIVPHTPTTLLARGPSQLRQSYRPMCDPFDLHQLSLQGGVTAAEVEGLWGTGPFEV
jgi:hypothetical protein